MWGSKPATCYSQETHNSVSQGRWMSREKQKNPNMKLLNGASDCKVSADLKTSLQFLVQIIQTEKRPDIVAWSDSKRSVLLIELIVPWEEKREEAHEWKKNRYEAPYRLRGKRLDMPRDSYWGWLLWFSRTPSHFVSFKNRNHWPQFESYLKPFSDHGAIWIKLDLVESMNEMHGFQHEWDAWFSAWMRCIGFQHEWDAWGTTIPVWLRKIEKRSL